MFSCSSWHDLCLSWPDSEQKPPQVSKYLQGQPLILGNVTSHWHYIGHCKQIKSLKGLVHRNDIKTYFLTYFSGNGEIEFTSTALEKSNRQASKGWTNEMRTIYQGSEDLHTAPVLLCSAMMICLSLSWNIHGYDCVAALCCANTDTFKSDTHTYIKPVVVCNSGIVILRFFSWVFTFYATLYFYSTAYQ